MSRASLLSWGGWRGRLALSDIVTEVELPSAIVCNAALWAACIGGALQQDEYRRAITDAGFDIVRLRDNPSYRFLSPNAQAASRKYGISLLAVRP